MPDTLFPVKKMTYPWVGPISVGGWVRSKSVVTVFPKEGAPLTIGSLAPTCDLPTIVDESSTAIRTAHQCPQVDHPDIAI